MERKLAMMGGSYNVKGFPFRIQERVVSQSEQFASDNYSGVCPQAWKAMEAANRMDEPAYGEDSWTQRRRMA